MARRLPAAQGQHDTAIGRLAAQWANPGQYNIATNPDGEKNRSVGPSQQYPDLIAWTSRNGRDEAVWIVEVETADSVTEAEARNQWADYAATGAPLSVAVPSGSGANVWALANRLGITIKKVFEFSNEYSQIHVVEVPQPQRAAWR
jgi:hypothetical protein